MSSSVTMPAVPPCSSTTMAMCSRRRRISSRTFHATMVSGTKYVGSANADRRAPSSVSPAARRRSRKRKSCFAFTTPTTLSMSSSYTGTREWPVAFTSASRSRAEALVSRASTSTRGFMTSDTRRCCRSSTPSIITPRPASRPPDSDAPPTTMRSSSSETTVAAPALERPQSSSVPVERRAKPEATGPTRRASSTMGGARSRAVRSALFTPMALGTSSPKKSVAAASPPVAAASARGDEPQ
mmetsp:Transcript_19751/g.58762  ORF Transcript_19751/g.58762 Transcript_19751/m.58762 type:complete len:241 (+) Transcript_19751:482-1204(+)